MKEQEIRRLLLVIEGSNSGSLDTNLVKIVLLTLYDSNLVKMTIDQIRKSIEANYDLQFTNEEIRHAIKNRKEFETEEKHIKTVKRGQTFEEKVQFYKIEERALQKIKDKENRNSFDTAIERFISEFQDIDWEKDKIKSLLLKFLYNSFLSNKESLLLLIYGGKEEVSREDENYTEEEKYIINSFLNWDNNEKDEIVFSAASYCVDYCMLTVKKDFSNYKDVFKGKSFYLDANVIFRLAGINNEERKIVTREFINKCISSGIKIKYTNFTYEEIVKTVKRNVGWIEKVTGGNRLVSPKHYKNFTPFYRNMDFILLYDKWVNTTEKQYNDYRSFEKFILSIINEVLQEYEKVDYISFQTRDDHFNLYINSLADYKRQQNTSCTDESVNIDVNNYLFIYDMRKSIKGTTFVDVNDYFISTDGNLCEWGKNILPSAVPIAVKPSVWHSLLLKFNGRTSNDYKAFNLFLNLRYRVQGDDDRRKPEILAIIQKMDEPVDIKNQLLEYINDNFETEFETNELPKNIVEEAKRSVILDEAKRISAENYKKEAPILQESSQKHTVELMARNRAQKKLKRWNAFINITNVTRIIVGVGIFIWIIGCVSTAGFGKTISSLKEGISSYEWIGLAISGISYLLIEPIKLCLNNKMKIEKIYEKELEEIKEDLF